MDFIESIKALSEEKIDPWEVLNTHELRYKKAVELKEVLEELGATVGIDVPYLIERDGLSLIVKPPNFPFTSIEINCDVNVERLDELHCAIVLNRKRTVWSQFKHGLLELAIYAERYPGFKFSWFSIHDKIYVVFHFHYNENVRLSNHAFALRETFEMVFKSMSTFQKR